MTAPQSATPPRDGEVCCPQGCVVGGCHTWQAPAAPSEPPAEAYDPDAQPWQRNLLAHHAEPPAETQQDDELVRQASNRERAAQISVSVGMRRIISAALDEAEQRGYERAQNECPIGGWESGL